MNIRQITAEIRRQLAGQYPGTEIESFVRILFGHYLGMTPALVHLSQEIELPAGIEGEILSAVDGLKEYRPIQYIFGATEFYGLPFEVTPDVLIPRPETEELVDWITHEYNKNAGLTIVDIGTGSGCIAVALAAGFPNAGIWAVDVSDAALAVARRNAGKNSVNVNFLLGDILKNNLVGFAPGSLDVIVSNPPYITSSEKQQMLPNVLEYEPHVALFAPEDDPLIFYKQIAAFGSKCLKDGGRVFFEINEAFPEELANILKQNGYQDITPRRDINGKWRMVSAQFFH
jgi:release factor glutamine methyltransferase